jgi:hypothetical protein
MSEPEERPAHLRPLIVEIFSSWPPEVALAVFELIDDLRDNILAVHDDRIHELLREQRGFVDPGARDARDDDQPFLAARTPPPDATPCGGRLIQTINPLFDRDGHPTVPT